MKPDAFRATIIRFVMLSALLISVGMIGLSLLAIRDLGGLLRPEARQLADTIGDEIVQRMQRMIDIQPDLRLARGVDTYFDQILRRNPELVYLALEAGDGSAIMARGDHSKTDDSDMVTLPVIVAGETRATIALGADPAFLGNVLREMSYDILTIMVVSLTVTFGLLAFFVEVSVNARIASIRCSLERWGGGDLRPRILRRSRDRLSAVAAALNATVLLLRERYQRARETQRASSGRVTRELVALGDRVGFDAPPVDDSPPVTRLVILRTVVFLFFLSEELLRPILPTFVKELAAKQYTLSSAGAVSLCLSMFILLVALAQPLGASWSERMGRRRTLVLTTLISAIGLVLTAYSSSYWLCLAARAVTAIGYGSAFATGTGYAVDNSTATTRTSSMAYFVGGYMAASVCGPPIGGILADYFGYSVTLLIAALMVASSAGAALLLMPPDPPAKGTDSRASLSQMWRIIASGPMIRLLLCCTIPAKIILNGALFYGIPLQLAALGFSQAVSGRIMMTYGVALVLLGPVTAGLTDRRPDRLRLFVGLGGAVSGLGLAPLYWLSPNLWTIALGVVLLGVGQSFSVSPQLALVQDLCREQSKIFGSATVLGVFRMMERAGGALGPLIAAAIAAHLGQAAALTAIGLSVTLGSLVFLLLTGSALRPKGAVGQGI